MSKPVVDVILTTPKGKTVKVPALFDTGAYFTIVRSDILPKGTPMIRFGSPRQLRTAGKTGHVRVIGETSAVVAIGPSLIDARLRISPDLNRELIIGAETMQAWDISVKSRNGHTKVQVRLDLRNPEITEVD